MMMTTQCPLHSSQCISSTSARPSCRSADLEVIHWDECCEYCDRQGKNRNQRGAEMKEEDDDDDADDDRFFEKVTLKSFDGGVNQSGSIVTGDDFDTGRQR